MKRLLLLSLLLALATGGVRAQDDDSGEAAPRAVARKYALLGACNLTLTTRTNKTYYYYTGSDQKALLCRPAEGTIVLCGDTFAVADVKSMKLCSMPRFILNEDSTYYYRNNELDHGLVALRRSLTVGQWNDICLPFALSGRQVTQAFGDDARLASVRGLDDGATLSVVMEEMDLATDSVVLKSGYHYLLLPTLEPDVSASQRLTFGERPYGPIWLLPSVSIAKRASARTSHYYNADSTAHVSVRGTLYRLDNSNRIGTLVRNKKADPGAYYLNDSTASLEQSADSLTLGGLRFWIKDLSEGAADRQLHLVLHQLDGTDVDLTGSGLTAIQGLTRDPRRATSGAAVYDLSGRRVTRISSPGFYLIDGKKVYVK